MMTRPYLLSTTSRRSSMGGLMMPSPAGVPATLCLSCIKRASSYFRCPAGYLQRSPGYQVTHRGRGVAELCYGAPTCVGGSATDPRTPPRPCSGPLRKDLPPAKLGLRCGPLFRAEPPAPPRLGDAELLHDLLGADL